MRKPTIRVSNEFDTTMVWYLNQEKAAVVVEVYKNRWNEWEIEFRDRKMTGFRTKADAVSQAKKWLKASM